MSAGERERQRIRRQVYRDPVLGFTGNPMPLAQVWAGIRARRWGAVRSWVGLDGEAVPPNPDSLGLGMEIAKHGWWWIYDRRNWRVQAVHRKLTCAWEIATAPPEMREWLVMQMMGGRAWYGRPVPEAVAAALRAKGKRPDGEPTDDSTAT